MIIIRMIVIYAMMMKEFDVVVEGREEEML